MGRGSIQFGSMRVKRGPFWIPDGLHIWWGSRGVHLFWAKSPHAPRVMFDHDPRPTPQEESKHGE